ncbi:MAG: dienelactone hydrolase family protein [Actinomycetota bacterium]
MDSSARSLSVPVADGAVPIVVSGPEAAPELPGLVVVPSIFGGAPDLLDQIASVSDLAVTAVMDPFWREGGGALDYRTGREAAFERMGRLDRAKAWDDVAAVVGWMRQRTNGRIAGLGICFGGPFVLAGAAEGQLAGVITWHGSRMENVLDRVAAAGPMTAPVRMHFGSADPITPPEAIDAISTALDGHPDCEIVVHPGLDHGFSHAGDAWDADAAAAGVASARDVLSLLGRVS